MLQAILMVVIIALLIGIAIGVQKGLNQIIKGLESIDQRLASLPAPELGGQAPADRLGPS